jgi:hypothetical protein
MKAASNRTLISGTQLQKASFNTRANTLQGILAHRVSGQIDSLRASEHFYVASVARWVVPGAQHRQHPMSASAVGAPSASKAASSAGAASPGATAAPSSDSTHASSHVWTRWGSGKSQCVQGLFRCNPPRLMRPVLWPCRQSNDPRPWLPVLASNSQTHGWRE